jgi:hypothetical protein
MTTMQRLRRLGTIVLIAILAGCGGGSGGGTGGTQPASFSFEPRVDLSTGGMAPSSVLIGDFNGDGKPDIAVANSSSNTIAVFLNRGAGDFRTPIITTVNIPNGLGPMAEGDFNEDGKLDLVVATTGGSPSDIILLGNGDGTFSQQPPVPNSNGYLCVQTADFEGHGHLDLVTAGAESAAVLLGNGHGTFSTSTLPPLPLSSSNPLAGFQVFIYTACAVGDFNGDGKLDIALSDGISLALVVYAGNGDGTFQSPISVPLFGGMSSMDRADFNGDGKLDILSGAGGGAEIKPGNGDGTFPSALGFGIVVYGGIPFPVPPPPTPPPPDPIAVHAADLDGDGKPDAIAADYNAGILAVVLNGSLGEVPPSPGSYQFTIAPGLNDIATGDLNGDGFPDIVVSNGLTNQISIFLSKK